MEVFDAEASWNICFVRRIPKILFVFNFDENEVEIMEEDIFERLMKRLVEIKTNEMLKVE